MTYTPRTQPRPHQAEALRRMAGKLVFALRMAQRTGKTWTVITEWAQGAMNGGPADLLVTAPAGCYRTWESELRTHLSEAFYDQLSMATWVSGNARAARECEWLLGVENRPRVLLVNTEAFSTVGAVIGLCTAFLKQRTAEMVIDESTSIRNGQSQRTKKILKLGPLAKVRRIMTGLISPKSPLDLWSQFAFLDWRILGHQSFTTFRARYAIIEKICMLPTSALAERLACYAGESWVVPGVGRVSVGDLSRQGLLDELERRRIYVQVVPLIKGYRHEDELRTKIEPWSFRVTLDDVREASPPVYAMRTVELTEEQKRVYREIKEFATSKLASETHVTATSAISQILRLHQVTCGFVKDELGEIHDIPTNRIKVLLEILAEYDGKAIIWCNYDRDIRKVADALKKEYGEESTVCFWGGNRAEREEGEARFKTDPACRFMCATPAAGSRGRTWDHADLAVWYSNNYDLEHRMQAEERTEAVDKCYGATRIDLVAKNTVDERILDALRNKLNLTDMINGDGWRKWLI